MNKTVFYIIFFTILFLQNGYAQQNLVPNPSFEDTLYCPLGTDNFQAVANWYSPTMGSPDYYNACANNDAGVPVNEWGYQNAQEGDSYIGLITYGYTSVLPNYREYIGVQLLQNLQAGTKYFWSLYISLLDSTDFASNNIGISLSNSPLSSASTQVLNTIIYDNHFQIETDQLGWKKISGSFIANGGENHLTIGNFYNDSNTNIIQVQVNSPVNAAYYYIDNVYIGKTENLEYFIDIPNVFTPNNDGVNDFFFTYDKGIKDKTIRILNRWGNVVFEGKGDDQWDGRYQNSDCSEGTYFYTIEFYNLELNRKERKTGFIQLVR